MTKHNVHALFGVIAILLLLLGGGGYHYLLLSNEIKETRASYASTTAKFENLLDKAHQENQALEAALDAEKNKNEEFASQIKDIATTVGTLEKLSQTDKELLQKYSKVYFLNEHFQPERLVELPSDILVTKGRPTFLHAKVWPYLDQLIAEAAKDKVPLTIVSAFRSFDTQSELKSNYKIRFGVGTANSFVADQGYSEHQLGTTVDFSTPGLGTSFDRFESTPAYKWLLENAHKYGFVLSYPKNNKYYIFEPWHWRFVGVQLASDLDDSGKAFYDLDQREIDKYLVNIFD